MALLQSDLKRVWTESIKATTDYESLKAVVLKAAQGKSALPMDVLNEVLEETRQRVLDTSHSPWNWGVRTAGWRSTAQSLSGLPPGQKSSTAATSPQRRGFAGTSSNGSPSTGTTSWT